MNAKQILADVPETLKMLTTIRFPGTAPRGKLTLGFGASLAIGAEAAALGAKTALLITDPILVKLGNHSIVVDSLAEAGIDCVLFSQVSPEPDMACIAAVETVVRENEVNLVVGLGGGSSMDVAKLAACLALSSYTAAEIMQNGQLVTEKLPTFLLPTTSGTGSEVSPYIVVSDAGTKRFISTPVLYATQAIVDPLLTLTMPARVTAATGLDALSHGVEGVCGCSNPYTQAMAAKCAELVFRYLPEAVVDGQNVEARYYMAFASVMGMLAYTQGGGLYAHSASYMLTADHKLPHGVGCGLALPFTLAYNKPEIGSQLEMLRRAIESSGRFAPADAGETIACFLKLVQRVGMPATLAEVGYQPEEMDAFGKTMVEKYYRAKNPRPMNVEGAVELAHNMYLGRLN